jgi:tripartite-type tricarboxylate transporter receptor subunit TctC
MPAFRFRGMRALGILVIASLASLSLWPAHAQPADGAADYPNRPVKIVIGFAAGGGTDAVARLVAQRLQEMLGGTFLVENRVGAGGRMGPDAVAKSAPDGYTLLGAAPGAMTISTAIYDKMPYDIIKDFTPISLISDYPLVVVVSKDHPARNVQELAAWLKANPAKANYPTPSPIFTLPIEYFKVKTGAPGTPIPYRSSNESALSLMGGQTAFAFIETPAAVPQISAGNLRPLAVTAIARMSELPEVPTLAEAGVPDVLATSWFGLLAPAGTPAGIIKKLEQAVRRISATEDFKTRMKAMSSSPVGSSSEEFAVRMGSEVKMWTAVAKSVNIKFEQ